MSFMRTLADRKQIILGTVLTPLGIYAGITLKEWQDGRKAAQVEHEVESSARLPSADHETDSPAAINVELDDLRNAAAAIRTREGQLNMELESINVKLKRLEAKIERDQK